MFARRWRSTTRTALILPAAFSTFTETTGSRFYDEDKYFWVQAESLAAAALLAEGSTEASERDRYWHWYDRLWDYSWTHFVDHRYGAWYRILTRDNRRYSDEKSPAGKVDYHTMGACHEVLNVIRG